MAYGIIFSKAKPNQFQNIPYFLPYGRDIATFFRCIGTYVSVHKENWRDHSCWQRHFLHLFALDGLLCYLCRGFSYLNFFIKINKGPTLSHIILESWGKMKKSLPVGILFGVEKQMVEKGQCIFIYYFLSSLEHNNKHYVNWYVMRKEKQFKICTYTKILHLRFH